MENLCDKPPSYPPPILFGVDTSNELPDDCCQKALLVTCNTLRTPAKSQNPRRALTSHTVTGSTQNRKPKPSFKNSFLQIPKPYPRITHLLPRVPLRKPLRREVEPQSAPPFKSKSKRGPGKPWSHHHPILNLVSLGLPAQ